MNSALLSRKYEFEVNLQALIAGILVIIAVAFVCCAAFTARTPVGRFDSSSLIPLIFLVPGCLFVVLNQALRLLRLKRDMRRSKDVLYGSLAAPLVEVQPKPQTPDLPLDIQLRRQWVRMVPYFMATTISVLLVSLLSNRLQSILGFPASALVTLNVSVLWLFLMLFQLPYPETQRIVATEDGMKVNDVSTISWSDVQLFAIIGLRQRNPNVMFYELADKEEALVFRVRTKPFAWHLWLAPDVSFAEYQAQTQQLLRFIVAKTGQPLLDLR